MTKHPIKTRQQARQDLIYRGISMTAWARQNNFNPEHVRDVLRKDIPCRFGESHKIAVRLGIKAGVIQEK